MSESPSEEIKPSKFGTGTIVLGAIATAAFGICTVSASFVFPAFRKVGVIGHFLTFFAYWYAVSKAKLMDQV